MLSLGTFFRGDHTISSVLQVVACGLNDLGLGGTFFVANFAALTRIEGYGLVVSVSESTVSRGNICCRAGVGFFEGDGEFFVFVYWPGDFVWFFAGNLGYLVDTGVILSANLGDIQGCFRLVFVRACAVCKCDIRRSVGAFLVDFVAIGFSYFSEVGFEEFVAPFPAIQGNGSFSCDSR